LVTDFLHFTLLTGRCFGVVAVGYIRVSSEAQVEDGVSLDAQRAKIESGLPPLRF
jgi:hypothetical protein